MVIAIFLGALFIRMFQKVVNSLQNDLPAQTSLLYKSESYFQAQLPGKKTHFYSHPLTLSFCNSWGLQSQYRWTKDEYTELGSWLRIRGRIAINGGDLRMGQLYRWGLHKKWEVRKKGCCWIMPKVFLGHHSVADSAFGDQIHYAIIRSSLLARSYNWKTEKCLTAFPQTPICGNSANSQLTSHSSYEWWELKSNILEEHGTGKNLVDSLSLKSIIVHPTSCSSGFW